MIRFVRLLFTVFLSFFLLSWGELGHRTIGIIAERHLSPKAKESVKALLGSESLSQASTWADEVRSDPAYRNAGPWHFINLPSGLSRTEFDQRVTSMSRSNVYEALFRMEKDLSGSTSTPEQKKVALKFIVHLVGDLHQPMHVSRAEDKGGNNIQVNYEGRGANLHALWDSRLLAHGGLNESRLADKVNHAIPTQIRQWQQEPVLQWIWESYQISTRLYSEMDQMKKRIITEDYYKAHIPLVEERLEKAGIRLAGVLNEIFEKSPVRPAVNPAPAAAAGGQPAGEGQAPRKIAIGSAASHLNETVIVCSRVYSIKELGNMTLVNLGASYPNQLLTVVLKEQARNSIKLKEGENICVTGRMVLYKGKPEIVVTDPNMVEGSK